jgi:hypothetical protein
MPYDRYASKYLHIDFARLGFHLKSLIIFSHMPRPLPHISVYGGVLEANFCTWLKQTLYAMPTLNHICILNYESPTPILHDMPSPRLIRMLRSSIFEDVMAECETLSEQNFEWHSLTDSLESSMSQCTTDEKIYHVYSSKLSRSVEIVFRTERYLRQYCLDGIVEEDLQGPLDSDPLLSGRSFYPNRPVRAYAGLLARKNMKSWKNNETGRLS